MKKSSFLTWNAKDFFTGLIMVIITAIVTGVYQIIQSGGLFDWVTLKPVLLAAIGAGLSYLIKNLFTNSEGTFMTKEQLKYKK
jgi:hypothetical protein